MNDIIKKIEAEQLKENAPEFNVGDTVKVYAKIKEGNRERIQVFEGTVLKRQGGGARETFTVRKTSNGIGVEKTWPIHSPHVEKVEVIRRGKVRRAKLNYLRKRVGKACKSKRISKIVTSERDNYRFVYCPFFVIAASESPGLPRSWRPLTILNFPEEGKERWQRRAVGRSD